MNWTEYEKTRNQGERVLSYQEVSRISVRVWWKLEEVEEKRIKERRRRGRYWKRKEWKTVREESSRSWRRRISCQCSVKLSKN